MLFAPFGRLDLDPIYDYLKILDVNKVKDLETSKFMYKLKNNILPVTIANYFQPVNYSSSTHSYSLRKREVVISKKFSQVVKIPYNIKGNNFGVKFHKTSKLVIH